MIFFATCPPGIEPVLHAEIKTLGLAKPERQVGGVYFEGALVDAWRANLELRTAIRVLWRVERFRAGTEEELYRGVSAMDWSRFLAADGSLRISAHVRDSFVRHSLYLAQKVKDAIVDQFRGRFGCRPNVDLDNPDLSLHVHVVKNRITLLVDTSGESLHRRGYRVFQGRAPLAETLAAAIVLLSGWDCRSPLFDPFCGSGTILIEAALISGGVAPGLFRRQFAFERLPGFDRSAWQELCAAARARVTFPPRLIIRGVDRDPRVASGARRNIRSAGFEGSIEVEEGDALEVSFRRNWNAWIVTNPPYGERIGDERQLLVLYRRFGERLRDLCGGYHLALLLGNRRYGEALGLETECLLQLTNGAIECELLSCEVPRQ